MADTKAEGIVIACGMHVYAGGFTQGMLRAGFEVGLHLESSGFGGKVVANNLSVSRIDTVEAWPTTISANVLFANPPCAPWSRAGRGGGVFDQRVHDFVSVVDYAMDSEVDVVLIESVQGAIKQGYGFIYREATRLADDGRVVYLVTYDNQHLGVPHTRRRFMLVASRYVIDLRLHEITTAPVAREVLDDVQQCRYEPKPLSDVKIKAWEESRPGENLVHAFDRRMSREYRDVEEWPRTKHGKIAGRPGFLHRRLDPDAVVPTLMGNATLLHYAEPRYLTIEEQKRCAGFDSDWWLPPNSSAYGLIGKGVMPGCGQWFGERIEESLRIRKQADAGVVMVDLEKQANSQLALRL